MGAARALPSRHCLPSPNKCLVISGHHPPVSPSSTSPILQALHVRVYTGLGSAPLGFDAFSPPYLSAALNCLPPCPCTPCMLRFPSRFSTFFARSERWCARALWLGSASSDSTPLPPTPVFVWAGTSEHPCSDCLLSYRTPNPTHPLDVVRQVGVFSRVSTLSNLWCL